MKIVCFSDTHSRHKEIILPNGDMAMFAGDCSGRGTFKSILNFITWYKQQPHQYKIMIAGNHDWGFQDSPNIVENLCKENGVIYLNDTSVTVEGYKIHGSPVTPKFCNWAFNRSVTIEESMTEDSLARGHEYIGNHWDKIPIDTDILITHGPSSGILDKILEGDSTGCPVLSRHIKNRLNLKLHVFGHIHEARGIETHGNTIFVNASCLNRQYQVYQQFPFVIEL